ncbi:hypothetical protein EIN_296570 [Entamoeba invadens IP1]|uniref:Uncharacterized protein n=1 Tax=Entamoeba invadens IP1 TaxID=370355 RepID=L7FL64_ENTIV|nr:hypothetical protein EIN_296570 [Entamoeba invadens IP1]ELP86347.1 hypothetical protein EIN_296570 [Entamoeba invadens IP1]|eukprot:XP_004185693.1 hypothetical protein EIN_296570 [Entamoeba invadens IP1]
MCMNPVVPKGSIEDDIPPHANELDVKKNELGRVSDQQKQNETSLTAIERAATVIAKNKEKAEEYQKMLKTELDKRVLEEKDTTVFTVTFEEYFMGCVKQVAIKNTDNTITITKFNISPELLDGTLFVVNGRKFRMKVVHPRFRRHNNDVFCYLKNEEINTVFKNIVETPEFMPISFNAEEVNGKEMRVKSIGFKTKNGAGDFVIKKVDGPIPNNFPSEIDTQRKNEKTLWENAFNLIKDINEALHTNFLQSDQCKKEGEKLKTEYDRLTKEKVELEERVEKEKEEIQQKQIEEEKLQKEQEKEVENLLKVATEEKRIVTREHKTDFNVIEYGKNKTYYYYTYRGTTFYVKVFEDGNKPQKKVDKYSFISSDMVLNVTLLGRKTKPRNKDFGDVELVLGALKDGKSVFVFDVKIPTSFFSHVYPVALCDLRQLHRSEELPLVYPVDVPSNGEVLEFIYANDFDDEYKDCGILVFHVHKEGTIEYHDIVPEKVIEKKMEMPKLLEKKGIDVQPIKPFETSKPLPATPNVNQNEEKDSFVDKKVENLNFKSNTTERGITQKALIENYSPQINTKTITDPLIQSPRTPKTKVESVDKSNEIKSFTFGQQTTGVVVDPNTSAVKKEARRDDKDKEKHEEKKRYEYLKLNNQQNICKTIVFSTLNVGKNQIIKTDRVSGDVFYLRRNGFHYKVRIVENMVDDKVYVEILNGGCQELCYSVNTHIVGVVQHNPTNLKLNREFIVRLEDLFSKTEIHDGMTFGVEVGVVEVTGETQKVSLIVPIRINATAFYRETIIAKFSDCLCVKLTIQN